MFVARAEDPETARSEAGQTLANIVEMLARGR
jgi:hypothetical protein